MSVSGIGSSSSQLVQALTSMRNQLDDLQRQLGTGNKSTNYAGLGLDRGLVVGLRNHLSAISSYADTTTNVNLRINLQQTTLTRIGTIKGDVKAATQTNFSIDASGQTVGQHAANAQFDEILNALNTQAGVGTVSAPYSSTLVSYIQQVISQQGGAAANADSLNQGQQVVVNSLQQRFADQSSVNIDEEMSNLLKLQTAYGANARVMSAIKEMLNQLLQM